MKKIFATGAALMLAGAMATTAAADFTIKGDARARIKYNSSFADKDTLDFDSRARFTIKGTADGGAYIVGRLRLDEGEWNGGVDASSNGNVWVDKAYLGIPFSDNFTVEAGRYRETLTNFLYEDISVSGIRGIYKMNNMTFKPFFLVENESQSVDTSTSATDLADDNDVYIFGANAAFDINDAWQVQANLLVRYDSRDAVNVDTGARDVNGDAIYRTEDPDTGWLASVFFGGKQGNFGMEGEVAYASQNYQAYAGNGFGYGYDASNVAWNGAATDGWGGYIQPSFTMDNLTLALQAGFTLDGFVPDAIMGFIMIGSDDPTTVVNIGEGGDWIWGGLIANFQAAENLALTANLAYAAIDTTHYTGSNPSDFMSDVVEVSGKLVYTISKGATFSWLAGYAMPSYDNETAGHSDDSAFSTYGKFEVKF